MTAPIRYEFWSCDGNSLHIDYYSFVYIPLCLRTRLQTWQYHFISIFINFHPSLSFIICIDLNHHCHHYWTSKSLLNLWECTQDSDITNKWVVHFVIIILFISLLISSANSLFLYLLPLVIPLNPCTNSSIILLSYPTFFNSATFIVSLSPLSNSFFKSTKNSSIVT